ncbi:MULTISPECIES: tetratricopeptide repeat protein [unclassified Streptomyces]|uniref:tetratricopeptide repeat protein n=1 Tax=unclassified Streptomyces TaxID=2593676 RepID=UPI0016556250|nr:tetratricopeptide repeat protein [Streptomyces sp. CB02980]MCB8905385.1 tetratricopeptide repeat protein [Streptomyces sp. CB02980]
MTTPTTLLRAEALYDTGRFAQAGELVAQHLAGEPEDAEALVLLARCHHRAEKHQAALEAVDGALRAEPELLMAWLMRVQILLELRRFQEAETAARYSVRLAPQYWGTHYALGTALAQFAEHARTPARTVEAYEAARAAVSLAPEEDAAHFLVGLTAQRRGDHATAQRAYEAALRLNPQSSEAHNNLSLLRLRRRWFRRGAWTQAAEGFVASAALDLQDRKARYNLEAMAWNTVAGARWVALLGFIASTFGAAPARSGDTGADAIVPFVIGVAVIVGSWGGWVLWMGRRVPPRLRRPMLLVARSCRPVIAMATAVGLLGLYSVVSMALWSFDAGVVGGLGTPLFWAVIITYWVSRSALNRRAPKD